MAMPRLICVHLDSDERELTVLDRIFFAAERVREQESVEDICKSSENMRKSVLEIDRHEIISSHELHENIESLQDISLEVLAKSENMNVETGGLESGIRGHCQEHVGSFFLNVP